MGVDYRDTCMLKAHIYSDLAPKATFHPAGRKDKYENEYNVKKPNQNRKQIAACVIRTLVHKCVGFLSLRPKVQ